MKKENKVSFKEFLSIQIWSLKISFEVSGFKYLLYLIFNSLNYIQSLIFPFIFAKTIDEVIKAKELAVPVWDKIIFYLFLSFFFTTIFSIVSLYKSFLSRLVYWEISRASRLNFSTRLHNAGVARLENYELANTIQRVDENLYSIQNQSEDVSNYIASIFTLVTQSIIIYQFQPLFLIIFAVVVFPIMILDRYYIKKLWLLTKSTTEQSRSAFDSLSYVSEPRYMIEVLVTNTMKYFQNMFAEFDRMLVRERLRIRKVWFTESVFLDFFKNIARVGSIIFVIKEFLIDRITLGQVTFYTNIFGQYISSLESMVSQYVALFERAQKLSEIKTIFELEPEKDGKIKIDLLTKGPEILFENVNFSYPTSKKLALKNINLHIKRGEKIAIVGHNGAGKTTLVKLICRFYRPQSGEIKANGIPINDLTRESWHKNIGALFQEYNTYGNLTVAENLALDSKIDKKKVRDALKEADAYEFVNKLPKKENQILSERFKGGTKLSTGQWQKIAVARFFYRNSPLVIFDEPTASIDAQSEKKIFDRIYKFFNNKTVIIISHRFSTVRNADRIIVVHDGEIIEEGSHQTLMKKNGIYADSFKLQAEGYN